MRRESHKTSGRTADAIMIATSRTMMIRALKKRAYAATKVRITTRVLRNTCWVVMLPRFKV